MKKALIISAHYKPEPNFITTNIAESLAKNGFDVKVITAHPNYPFGRFYDSVKTIRPSVSIENQVKVWRIPFFPNHSKSIFKRAFSYISFAIIAALMAPFIVRTPNIVLVYQTPFTTALASLWFKFFRSSKLYYICCDLWPESFSASGVVKNSLMNRISLEYSRIINKQADFLICSTVGITQRYLRDGISSDQLAFVPVWTDGIPEESVLDFTVKKNSKSLVYAGNIGTAQGLDVLLEAAQLCLKDDIDIEFKVYGTGTEFERLSHQALTFPNVKFFGRVSPEEAFEAMATATAVLVHLNDTPLFRLTLPSKLAGAFASGGVVIAGLSGEGADVVRSSQCGLVFTPGNARELAESLRSVSRLDLNEYSALCLKSVRFYRSNFMKSQLIKYYVELAETGRTKGMSLQNNF